MFGEFLSLLSIGIGLGAVYAIGAVGLALIVRFTGILHFAHGAVFVLASYVLLTVSGAGELGFIVPAALVASGVAGWLIYEAVYRPLERRRIPALGFVIASFGVLIIAENAMTLGFGSTARSVAWPGELASGAIHLGPVTLRVADMVATALALITIGVLAWYRRHTRTGLLLRALERNKQLAADLGISYRRYAPVIFVIGSLLAGIAAVLSSFTVPIAPEGGLDWTVSVYIAMAVGGTGSIWSAASGGLALGILSTVPDLWIAGSWNTALAFGVLVLMLLVMPNGLMPGRDAEAVGGSPAVLLLRRVTALSAQDRKK
ncbi:MAG: branched-chain amino acid ABC transporter permease [Streptosporangiaceae bacterium]|jgi:branched-subunit amino acid ABC-type transport system permease component